MKILTILGARPQFIKAAVLSRLIKNDESTEEVIVHTGQHYDSDMSDVFFEEMHIPLPKYHLNIQSKLHGEMTGRMMQEVEKIALNERPDWVLVYGDTNSTLAGALIATKLHLKLAHVEAGLRSFDNSMPEEINRIITDRVSDLLFCPTKYAMENLEQEGFTKMHEKKIVPTGDIMYDASLYYSRENIRFKKKLPQEFILCTIHRAENTDHPEKLLTIFESLNKIGKIKKVVLPLHPRTKDRLERLNESYPQHYNHIIFIKPLSYLEMIWCLKNCAIVITDSGGLQKEAYFFKKMCLTLRDNTEWKELVDHGYNILSNINEQEIIDKAMNVLRAENDFEEMLYGNGHTGELILKELKRFNR